MKTLVSRPKTVVELFENHPERWTKGSMAKNSLGESVSISDERAVCWCLYGAFTYIYAFNSSSNDFCKNFPNGLVTTWNDDPERTFKEVLNKCKELNI